MEIIKINNKKYLSEEIRNITYIYELVNDKLNTKLHFSIGYSLCSNMVIQGLYIYDNNLKNKEFITKIFEGVGLRGKIILSVQNTSKSDYKDLLKLGFKDYFRLPGAYTDNSYGGLQNVSTNVALSVMVFTSKDLKPALKETLKLISNEGINNEVSNTKTLSKESVICIEPSQSLTKNKIYTVIEKKENNIKIISDKKTTRFYKSSRFEKVTF